MKFKRTLACLFIVAALPLLASPSHNNSAPFASLALAGHVFGGGYYCQCGSAGCICDPGEIPPGSTQSIKPITTKSDSSFNQSTSPVGAASIEH